VLDNGGGNPGAISNAVTLLLCGQPVPTPKRPIADVMGKKIEMDGIDAAIAHYHQLKKMETDEYNFGEGQLNRLGYMYLQQEKAETAIQIFRLNVEAYPDAWNPYDSLGEAYLAAGDRDQAIANYRKSLELNSENETAKATLKRLGVK
jgi:tetratricopeptide (TPR) repeat protein